VIVPDNQLSLAIGKEGQNARLAAKLTGWRIDIKSESQIKEIEARKIFADLPAEEEAPATADGESPVTATAAAQPAGLTAAGSAPEDRVAEGAARIGEKSVAE